MISFPYLPRRGLSVVYITTDAMPSFSLLDKRAELRRDMAGSSAWLRAELARRRSQKQETKRPQYALVRDFDDLCP